MTGVIRVEGALGHRRCQVNSRMMRTGISGEYYYTRNNHNNPNTRPIRDPHPRLQFSCPWPGYQSLHVVYTLP